MNPILQDTVWLRKGISVLWDNKVLTEMITNGNAISLREFFSLYEQNWPDNEIPLIDENLLLVAGLDAALDSLSAEDSEEWVNQEVYRCIYDFQSWSEGEYALVLWMTDQHRWKEQVSENRYTWICDGKDKGKEIDLGSGIWNGAQKSIQRIEVEGRCIGLYLERIS
jgi:hypothetical protein